MGAIAFCDNFLRMIFECWICLEMSAFILIAGVLSVFLDAARYG